MMAGELIDARVIVAAVLTLASVFLISQGTGHKVRISEVEEAEKTEIA